MIKGNYSSLNFQTFYVSKEVSNCPLISDVIRLGKKFSEKSLLEDFIEASVSLRYGKRVLINAKNSDLGEINKEDFLEIVDYNPLKRVLLAMGPKEPRIETSVHWLIHHARNEVNAIIQINDKQLARQLGKKLPITEKEYPDGTLEQAKEILRGLRNSKKVVIKNQGVIFVGNSMKDVEDSVLKTYEELK